jgi:dethiobiotin synthetase
LIQTITLPLPPRILFITGTDTGVGKTMLTALLLAHLRQSGCHALALKPFCSGSRADADLLHALQEGVLTLDEINPFFFSEPVAPLVAARKHDRSIRLAEVLNHVHCIQQRLGQAPARHAEGRRQALRASHLTGDDHPCLLIEGSGGLLVPLAEGFSILDLIAGLNCETVVVARNKLGTINHTLLTVRALQSALRVPQAARMRVVLMDSRYHDLSARSNGQVLEELLAPIPLISLPFLGPKCGSIAAIKKIAKKLKKVLAQILA